MLWLDKETLFQKIRTVCGEGSLPEGSRNGHTPWKAHLSFINFLGKIKTPCCHSTSEPGPLSQFPWLTLGYFPLYHFPDCPQRHQAPWPSTSPTLLHTSYIQTQVPGSWWVLRSCAFAVPAASSGNTEPLTSAW